MFTSHGHHIPGTVLDDTDDNQRNVARCGGPGLCAECSQEAVKVIDLGTPKQPEITKRQFILDIAAHLEHATSNFILFEYRDVDSGFVIRSLIMPRKEWSEMGCPLQITTTLEPGNTLNG